MDSLTDGLNSPIYVISSPLVYIAKTSRVLLKGLCVRKRLSSYRVRIEIVIHVNGLDVISVYDIAYDGTYPIARDIQTRIEIPLFIVLPEPLRMLSPDMVCANHGRVCLCQIYPIRIKPYMYLHVTRMCLLNGPFKRIPS